MSDSPTQTSLELNEPAALRRARLVVAYDGSGFHGFAAAEGVRTVMGSLTEAVSRVSRLSESALGAVGAGRTDAGVHAWGQVVSLDLPSSLALDGLVGRLNKLLGPEISVRSAVWAAPDFNARFDAQWRHYRYDVWNSPAAVPVYAATTWHVRQPLQLWAMQLACDPLIGEHDFSSFCRKPKVADGAVVPSMRRRVMSARWHVVHDDHHVGVELDGASIAVVDDDAAPPDDLAGVGLGLVRFEIRANAFCHQMVRSIVGLLVDVGLGRRSAGEVRAVLAATDRGGAGQVAPPHGLTLWDVGYPT